MYIYGNMSGGHDLEKDYRWSTSQYRVARDKSWKFGGGGGGGGDRSKI